jgi:hypothetical protein
MRLHQMAQRVPGDQKLISIAKTIMHKLQKRWTESGYLKFQFLLQLVGHGVERDTREADRVGAGEQACENSGRLRVAELNSAPVTQ